MFYIVEVPAGKVINPHYHDESIFRILIEGDLKVNGVEIKVGEWFVVLAGTTYSIKTQGGYTSLSAYTSNCRTSTMTLRHLERGTD